MRKVCPLSILVPLFIVLNVAAAEVQLPVVSVMSERYRSYELHGEMYSDASIHIWVTTAAGERLFDSRYPVQKAGGKFLEWQYAGQNVVTQSTPIPDGTYPSLEDMFFASKDIVKMLGGGAKPPAGALIASPTGQHFRLAPMDDWGCDDLQGVSCTVKGVCCDIHDSCYEQFGCSALSWLGLGSPACTLCNVEVVACLADFTHWGQSVCCTMGNCGQHYYSEGGGGVAYDDRSPLNLDPSTGGTGGSGGFIWAWTPYGSVGIGMGYYCAFIIGGQRVIVQCL